MLNTARLNTARLNVQAAETVFSWGLELVVYRLVDHVSAWPLRLVVQDQAVQPSWGLSLQVAAQTLQPSWGLSLRVSGATQPAWGLSLAVVDKAALLAAPAHAWALRASLAGADVSARLIGASEIVAEANSAALATFSLLPPSGAFDPSAYVGQAVVLRYLWTDAASGVSFTLPLFTGQVDAVAVDAGTFIATITCSDRRRGLLMGSDAATLATLLPGSLWSAGVFRAEADSLQQAEDRLSTLCADFDLRPDGSPALTPWAAKSTPDWSVTPAAYLDGTLGFELASSTDLVHTVTADFTYRTAWLRYRVASFRYEFALSDLFTFGISPPASSTIQEAVENTDWDIVPVTAGGISLWTGSDQIRFTRPNPSYNYNGAYYIVDAQNTALTASCRLGKRCAQSVDEAYSLTLVCGANPDPRLKTSLSGSLENGFAARAWEEDGGAPVLADPGWAAETVQEAPGDAASDRAAAAAAIQCLLAQGRRVLLAAHRQNRVSFSVPLNPFLDRTQTLALATPGVEAQGKVQRLRHVLDPDAGRATTDISLAISRPSLAPPAAESALAAPAAPAITAITADLRDAHSLRLGNIVGGHADAEPWDEDMQGYIVNIPSNVFVDGLTTSWGYAYATVSGAPYGNASGDTYSVEISETEPTKTSGSLVNPAYQPDKSYPPQFRLICPEVEDAARDNLILPVAQTYQIVVPADPLTLTNPY